MRFLKIFAHVCLHMPHSWVIAVCELLDLFHGVWRAVWFAVVFGFHLIVLMVGREVVMYLLGVDTITAVAVLYLTFAFGLSFWLTYRRRVI